MSYLRSNVTLNEVLEYFHLNETNVLNESEVQQRRLLDLYQAYKSHEEEQVMIYKLVAYVIGSLIVLSNLIVVVSSGLILKKGQQPKSTYLLLGNVSLADTIMGVSIIFGATIDNWTSSNSMCIFQIGMLVCPAMASMFTVGLIAVDRYIYILHGLYYQRWFNSTRVRIGIVIIWMIGVILGFMPATGWVNTELVHTRCDYVALFPGALILLNSLLSTVPIIIVAVLYSIILVKALKTVKSLNAADNIPRTSIESNDKPRLRMYRGTVNDRKSNSTNTIKYPEVSNISSIKRSSSFNLNLYKTSVNHSNASVKSKSIDDLLNDKSNTRIRNYDRNVDFQTRNSKCASEFSIWTVDSRNSSSNSDLKRNTVTKHQKLGVTVRKVKEPNKWRAITVVMLTSGSFIVTWLPFFIIVIFFVFCEEKLTNPHCIYQRSLLGGPIATLAFFNSILNPLIYAWWHKGFQKSVKMFYNRYIQKYFCRNHT